MNSKLAKGILLILVFTPIVLVGLEFFMGAFFLFPAITNADPSEKRVIVMQSLDLVISLQFFYAVLALPGLLFASYLSFKSQSIWHRLPLRLASYLALPIFPVFTAYGLYLFWLSAKAVKHA